MNKILKIIFFSYFLCNWTNFVLAKGKFYNQAVEMFYSEQYEDSKFLFERNIVYNPKDASSYLYLAKIYKYEENQKKEEKNLETTLLIDPNNEEAMLMLMYVALDKSNYLKVKEISDIFIKVCKDLCVQNNKILDALKNIEPKNES